MPADVDGVIQPTEKVIGPYELQDFNLFYVTRFGFRPSKIAYLAHHAWSEVGKGAWPEGILPEIAGRTRCRDQALARSLSIPLLWYQSV